MLKCISWIHEKCSIRLCSAFMSQRILVTIGHQGAYATGRLEDSEWQNDEKMSRKIGNAHSHATFFRHSAILSLPVVLLRKLPIYCAMSVFIIKH